MTLARTFCPPPVLPIYPKRAEVASVAPELDFSAMPVSGVAFVLDRQCWRSQGGAK